MRQRRLAFDEYARMADEIAADTKPRKLSSSLEYAVTSFSRLVGDCLGITYSAGPSALEIEFWRASERCDLVPGADDVVRQLRSDGVRLGIASNMAFSSAVIEYELRRLCPLDRNTSDPRRRHSHG